MHVRGVAVAVMRRIAKKSGREENSCNVAEDAVPCIPPRICNDT
jgi:hypothetical protein